MSPPLKCPQTEMSQELRSLIDDLNCLYKILICFKYYRSFPKKSLDLRYVKIYQNSLGVFPSLNRICPGTVPQNTFIPKCGCIGENRLLK